MTTAADSGGPPELRHRRRFDVLRAPGGSPSSRASKGPSGRSWSHRNSCRRRALAAAVLGGARARRCSLQTSELGSWAASTEREEQDEQRRRSGGLSNDEPVGHGDGELTAMAEGLLGGGNELLERGGRKRSSRRLQGASKRARGRVEDGESGNCIRRPWTGKKTAASSWGHPGLSGSAWGFLGPEQSLGSRPRAKGRRWARCFAAARSGVLGSEGERGREGRE